MFGLHLGLQGLFTPIVYLGMFAAFFASIFWKPHIGIYYLVPLLPMQTLRYRFFEYPLGNKLIDIVLLGILIGILVRRDYKLIERGRMVRYALFFTVLLYALLWKGAFYLGGNLPLLPDDPRFSNWKNYIEMFALFIIAVSAIKTTKQMKIVVLLACISLGLVSRSFFNMMRYRDTAAFSYSVRDGGPLGYTGVNGLAAYEVQMTLFILGLYTYQRNIALKSLIIGFLALTGYCIMFSYSRGAYLGFFAGLLAFGILRERKILILMSVFLLTWQVVVPQSVYQRVTMTYDQTSDSLELSAADRVTLWEDAVNLIESNPVLGTGFDTYEFMHRVGTYKDTHNYYLKVAVESGAIGLMLFLLFLLKLSAAGWRLFRQATDPFLKGMGLGLFLMLIGVWVVNLFGDRWSYIEINGVLWVVAAMVVRSLMTIQQETLAAEAEMDAQQPPQLPTEQPVYA
jgi:O-antigen ligase